MARTPCLTDLRNRPPSPITSGNGEWQRAESPPRERPAANPRRRRFARDTLGFWLGGILLGVGGCLYGASRPYQYPVGVAVSVLWWGIYCGALGASIGALVGLWAEPSRMARAGPPGGTDSPGLPAGSSGPLGGANRGSTGFMASSTFPPVGHARSVASAGER
jgi:hypothetical protein